MIYHIRTDNDLTKVDSLSVDEGGISTNSDGVIVENDTNAFEPIENLENGIELNSYPKRLDSSSISINEVKLICFYDFMN